MSERLLGLLLVALSVEIASANSLRSFLGHLLFKHKRNRSTNPSEEVVSSAATGGILKIAEESWRELYSDSDSTEKCHIKVENLFTETILFCWIDEEGKLHHYYPINDGSIKDGSVSNKHVEFSCVGHGFVGLRICDELPKTVADITHGSFLFYYKPHLANYRHEITIEPKQLLSFSKSPLKVSVKCVSLGSSGASAVVDTSKKLYDTDEICGFRVMVEPDVFSEVHGLRETLNTDLEMIRLLLPRKAFRRLSSNTKFWVNKSISFGPESNPVIGSTCTYHPKEGGEWLRANGMRTDKAGDIEIYCAEEYLQSRSLWGIGGVLLHELCHAYHDQHCIDGYNNEDIRQAYTTAMKAKRYDAVPVHGKQGENGLAKAYACTNCMEFFAELSVALHWTADMLEYNKWFPFNREQLKNHDFPTYRILCKMWNIKM